MDFEEFKERFTEDVKTKLYESGLEVSATNNEVTKMNKSYNALTIKPDDSNIGVNLNLDYFYEAVENGVDYNSAVNTAVDAAKDGIAHSPEIEVGSLLNYEEMKGKLIMEVVSKDTNKELLETVPHKDMEDMSVVYKFELSTNEDGRATILVTNDILDKMDVTPEQLHQDAMENAPELNPVVITSMSDIMAEMTGMDKEELVENGMIPDGGEDMMLIASTPDRTNGAGVIAYQNFMDQAAERVGGDFFILPSSVHEVLIVPDNGTADLAMLKDMVETVNATQVAPEDKLTDSVYHYDSKDKVFELGEKFVERMQAKEADKEMEADITDKDEKPSIMDTIKAKKEEIAKETKDAPEKSTKTKSKGQEI